MAVWAEPGNLLRSFTLRPGLNIIWSPDDGNATGIIGHGSGKSTFSRCLRYCLGEDSFATDTQRHRITSRLPDGMVGAEIILHGECWAVLRTFSHPRQSIVVKGASSLEDVFSPSSVKVGLADLKAAIASAVLGDSMHLMPPSISTDQAWDAALAWSTRDQECRFAHALEWRDSNTESLSPVRGKSKEDLLLAVRSFIRAFTIDELRARERATSQERIVSSHKTQLSRLDWQIERSGRSLRQKLGIEQSSLNTESLPFSNAADAANDRIRKVLALPSDMPTDLGAARERLEEARAVLQRLKIEEADAAARLDTLNQIAAEIQAELPISSAEYNAQKIPVCQICKVPLDETLVAGCGLSTVACDLESLRISIETRTRELDEKRNAIQSLRARQQPMKGEIALAQIAVDRAKTAVDKLERAFFDRMNEIKAAERAAEAVKANEALGSERDQARDALSAAEEMHSKLKDELAAHRDARVAVFHDLSSKFDAILRELVPGDVSGKVTLDGNGLHLTVEMNGERSTAALDSWKVVAFDLAVLAMTIEGSTNLSGLLLHDSPREADLGFSLYERLFWFARKLEESAASPTFQYIVTTTTEPPPQFQEAPWRRLLLRSAPASERFLGVDL